MLALPALSVSTLRSGEVRAEPIDKAEIRDRAFHFNGKPFFPITARSPQPAGFVFNRLMKCR